jgi:ATP-dependent helicase/nuclease subunit A
VQSTASELVDKYFDPDKGHLRDTMIRAGAGAGKTTELVRRVISIALMHRLATGEWPRLVVTTFTRKATQELRERLMQGGLLLNRPDVAELMQAKVAGLDLKGLTTYLQSSQSLHISTIHGILSVFLKRYGSQLELPPDFQLVSERQSHRLFRQTLRQLLTHDEAFADDFQVLREDIDMATLEASVHQFAATKLEKGAGVTRLSVEAILKEAGARQKQLQKNVQAILPSLQSLELTDTWQKREAALGDFLISDRPWPQRLQALAAAKGGALKGKAIPETVIQAVTDVFTEAKALADPFFDPDHLKKLDDLSMRFERIALLWSQKFEEQKVQTAVLTMEDLELVSLRLIAESKESARKFSLEWDYWLIDEYQDTSPRQVQLIEALTHGQKMFLVGDPQQSIYLFRGARSEVFFNAEARMRAQGGHLIEQMTNYRTAPPVLEFMNELFLSASTQLTKMSVGKKPSPLDFAPVTLWQVSQDNKKERVQVEAVAQRILELKALGVPLESICVIARKRSDLALIAARASELGIPCQMHAAGEFYQRQEVRDALVVLKFLLNPDDNVNLVKLLRSPWLSMTDQELLQICALRARSYWSVLLSKKADTIFSETADLLAGFLAALQTEGVARTWRRFLMERGFFDYAVKIDPSGRREANLWKLVQSLLIQERDPGFQYLEFVEQSDPISIDESSDGDASPVIEPKRVQLMTVHGSKGLQFPHVLVPYLDEIAAKRKNPFFGFNPDAGIWSLCLKDPESHEKIVPPIIGEQVEAHKSRELEEADRVLYVALTRAQESLHLFWKSVEKNKWVQKLDLFSQDSEDESYGIEGANWTGLFRKDRPAPTALDKSFQSDFEVRGPWSSPVTQKARGQVISVTQVLSMGEPYEAPANLALAAASSARKTWERVRRSVRGTDVHRLLESLKYDPSQKRATPEYQVALDFLHTGKGQFLLDVIRSGEVEWGFAAQLSGFLIQGQIDLWGRDAQQRLWVVDYKTGSPDKVDSALAQLEIYAWALRHIGKIPIDEPIELAAVFPFHGEVVTKKTPPQKQLERALKSKLESGS